jgi:general secretion pathway protein B
VSYILDALNKSEQERRNLLPPGLDASHGTPAMARKSKPYLFLLFILLLGINGGFTYWYYLKPADQERKPPVAEISIDEEDERPVAQSTGGAIPVSVTALPASIQRKIPDIQFSSHIYADDPSLRMVNINGKIVREGESVADGISLVEISEGGVVLSYQNYRFEMSILRDWSFD